MRICTIAALLLLACQGTEGDLLRPVPQPDLSPGTPECVTDLLNFNARCIGEAEWKTQVNRACMAKGLGLREFTVFEQCDGALFRHAKYTCCPRMAQGTCTPEVQGGPTSCKGEREWHAAATAACGAAKMVPSSLTFKEQCGDLRNAYFRYVSYLCCPPPPPIM